MGEVRKIRRQVTKADEIDALWQALTELAELAREVDREKTLSILNCLERRIIG